MKSIFEILGKAMDWSREAEQGKLENELQNNSENNSHNDERNAE